ncbi:DUF2065 domain-containing protein [Roseateles sp. SL47]|jgi:uncharacterized protein|uniref:DUF2065 domain-containing protein n=1 Tax=Roseateles sp. SL47 TaxID=2995138 RepID=UPI002271B812|nr:DUF2065 domain-containing protein [Roseateles sp. SL47]WAC72758.1 DUF2065 domain-containing protein [Roseateles sp. SL47]
MNGTTWWAALALMLLAEGLMPFISPSSWRDFFSRLMAMSDGQLRFIGLACVLCGVILLWLVA